MLTLCDTCVLTVTAFLCHSHHGRLTCCEGESRNNVSPKGCKARAVETWGLGWWEKCGLAVLRRKQCCGLSAGFSSLSPEVGLPSRPSGGGVLLLPLHQGPQPYHSMREYVFTCLRPDRGRWDFIVSQLHPHCLGWCWANLLNEKKMEEYIDFTPRKP